MTAYYNEIDEFAAEWLRNLIAAGEIAPGDVDTRSIEDVSPDDLKGYTQCHFFAGIGVWSHALRRAGWPDDRPVWTGSCPCQPFSAAGKGGGFADERHLWPAFHWLIGQCRPDVVFGEQVASRDGLAWLDLVQADLEGSGYAVGAVDTCAAGFGAPHIRQRLYWVADATGERCGEAREGRGRSEEWARDGGESRRLADAELQQRQGCAPDRDAPGGRNEEPAAIAGLRGASRPRPTDGFWRDADWLGCRDGKWRPVEASPQPLADGSAESLGRVRDSCIAEVQEEIDAWSVETKSERAEALRALRQALGEEARSVWKTGRVPGLHEAPFLLAFVRQLEAQGWKISEGTALSCTEAARSRLRELRDAQTFTGASRQRGLGGQFSVQPSNALHLLSSILARHAQTAWGNAYAPTATRLSRRKPKHS